MSKSGTSDLGSAGIAVGLDNAPAPNHAIEIGGVDSNGNLIPIAVDSSGHIIILDEGTVTTTYNEVTAVANSVLTAVATYTALGPTRLQLVEAAGSNIGMYTVLVNGVVIDKRYTYYGGLNAEFEYNKGIELVLSDIVTVKVIHNQPYVGDFNALILVVKDY